MQLKRQRKKLRAQHQSTENIYEKTVIIERTWVTDSPKSLKSPKILSF